MKFLKDWVSERKATQVADELTPGEWFRGEWSNWQKTLQEWKKVQTDTKTKIVAKSRASKKAKPSSIDDVPDGEDEEMVEDLAETKVDTVDLETVTDVPDGEDEEMVEDLAETKV